MLKFLLCMTLILLTENLFSGDIPGTGDTDRLSDEAGIPQ